MPVIDPNAIRFSNEYVRTRADRLAKEYSKCANLVERWTALGGGAPATAVLGSEIQALARYMIDNQSQWLLSGEEEWLGWGVTLILAGGGTIQDGAGAAGDGRPVVTADQEITLVTHWRERISWLMGTGGVWTIAGTLGVGGNNLNSLITAYYNPTAANCGTAINRFTELKTQYEANSNAILNSILAVAVNTTY